MNFDEGKRIEKIGIISGYILMYLIFTTIFYFILTYFKKIPSSWGYIHVSILSLILMLVGKLIKTYIK